MNYLSLVIRFYKILEPRSNYYMKKNCLDLSITFSVERLSWNFLMLATLMLKVASYVHFFMRYENIANYFPRLIQDETLSNHWLINSLLTICIVLQPFELVIWYLPIFFTISVHAGGHLKEIVPSCSR